MRKQVGPIRVLALAYRARGEFQQAREVLQKALLKFPDNPLLAAELRALRQAESTPPVTPPKAAPLGPGGAAGALEREHPARVGAEEAAAIRRELARRLGPATSLSNDYLLDVLGELGVPVAPELGGFSPELFTLLRFDTLEAAEATLGALDRRWREACAEEQREAAEDCRRAVLLARRRAEMLARNRKVAPQKRVVKEEIAQWFKIWLETPHLFFDWLALRKATEDFRTKFQARHPDPEPTESAP